jgi:hypothetical protein
MNEFIIKENYENYERVKKAFKDFIHALVWESMDIDEGVHEDEVNNHIERYCITMGDGVIHDVNGHVKKYIKSLESHYYVHCYEIKNGDLDKENAKHFQTNNIVFALKKAAEFYRNAKCPLVEIYDNEESKYIAKWFNKI